MQVTVLGAVGISVDEAEVAVPAGKPRALLAMLALAGGAPVSVDQLLLGVWGDDPPLTAAKTLQVHVSTLRSRLRTAGATVELSAAGYRLDCDPDDIDVVGFERLAHQGLTALADARHEMASRTLQRALDVWSGDPLSNVLDAPFAAHEADRLALRRLAVTQARLDADVALGLGATLVDEVRRIAEANPYDERACRHLMVALYRAGQPASALEECRRYRRTIAEELGLEPGPELLALERQVLMHDDSLLVRRQPGVDANHNLPRSLSSLVGRERELDHVRRLARRSRLVTLTGAGGVGKTRLALATVDELVDDFPAGVWLVELGSVTAPEMVVASVAEVIGVPSDEGLDGLVAAIGSRPMLVVVDNCEHLVDAVSKLADALLRSCAELHVVATSREPLAIDGESVVRVPPLGLPDPEVDGALAALRSDAVRLFADRAALRQASFAVDDANAALVAQICRQLDGVPLAIELAAARVGTFTLDELSRRLDERFRILTRSARGAQPRQRTLRAVVDWSYDLLTADERALFEQLSVFAGGFTLDAVEAVCELEPHADVLDVIGALVDKSLVETDVTTPGRLRMLETIRSYAAERFAARSADVTAARKLAHARHYLAIAEEAARALDQGPGQHAATQQLTKEHANLRAAADTFLHAPEGAEGGLRLAHGLWLFWSGRGLFREGADTAMAVADRADAAESPEHYVLALCTAMSMLEGLGDLERAEALVERAVVTASGLGRAELEAKVALRRSVLTARRGDVAAARDLLVPHLDRGVPASDLARLRTSLAFYLWQLNDVPGARASLEEAGRVARGAGNELRLAGVLTNLASLDLADGDLDSARVHLEEAHALGARLSDRQMSATIAASLGLVAIHRHDHVEARTRYREALLLAWPAATADLVLGILLGLASCCVHDGKLEVAATLHGAIDAAEGDSDSVFDPSESLLRRTDRDRLRSSLQGDEFDAALRRGRAMSLDEAVALARHSATAPLASVGDHAHARQ